MPRDVQPVSGQPLHVPPGSLRRWLPCLPIGLAVGLVEVAVVGSFAALIFAGDLAAYMGQAMGLALLAAAINIALISLLATLPGTLGGSQELPVTILAVVAASIAQQLSPAIAPQAAFLTVLAAIAITSLVTGLVLLLLGHFKLGRWVRYLPYPVVGGVLAGTGWLLCAGAITTMATVPGGPPLNLQHGLPLLQPELLARWLPGLLFAGILLWAHTRTRHVLLIPVMVVAGVLLFHALMSLGGHTVASLSADGWLLGPFGQGGLWRDWAWADLASVQWHAIAGQAFSLATIPVLSAVALLLNATALELASRRDVDLNRELQAAGVANLAAGLAGGLPGFQETSTSLMAQRMGAAHRLTGLVAALVCGLALWHGAALLSLIPDMVLGGLLLFLGLSLLLEWVWQGWTTLSRLDYAVLIVIVAVTATVGFLPGVAVGLLAAVLLFVVHCSRIEVVRQVLSGAVFHSRVTRSAAQRHLLAERGDATCILQLQGFLFFGTADRLLAHMRERLGDPALPTLRFVVLDFRRVSGIDSTAGLVFAKLHLLMQPRGLRLIVTEASPAVLCQFGQAGLHPGQGYQGFADLDRGLEWCEAQLLAPLPAAPAGDPAADANADPAADPAADLSANAELALRALLAQLLADPVAADGLLPCLHRVALRPGQLLMRQGDVPDHLYLLAAGQLTAQRARPGREPLRLQTLRDAQVVGEVGFYLGQPRSADVVADVPSVVYSLSVETLRRIEQQQPELALALQRLVLRLLAGRANHLADALEAIQR